MARKKAGTRKEPCFLGNVSKATEYQLLLFTEGGVAGKFRFE